MNRKADHVNICLKEKVESTYNYWDDISLVHTALPEVNYEDIDLSTMLFGKRLKAPLIIAAMTGGYSGAEGINKHLAAAAEHFGIGMGVGSQRPALYDKAQARTFEIIREFDIPLVIANIGAPQLIPQQKKGEVISLENVREIMEMIDADVLAVHLNYLQEVVQPEGDKNAEGCYTAIKSLAAKVPVVAKETGAGISKPVAMALKKAGVIGIDVGGLSGTSFSAVEVYRARAVDNRKREQIGLRFWDWGIPTPVSLIWANVGLPMIATGGLRNGLDVAKAIALGASAGGIARALLKPATESTEATISALDTIIEEIKVAMFLTGSANVRELGEVECVVTGRTREWLQEV